MEESISASEAVRRLCRAGMAFDYRHGMDMLKERAVWTRVNMVTVASVDDMIHYGIRHYPSTDF